MLLKVEKLEKRFGKKEVLRGISFEIPEGKCLGLLGESGCGKSTTAAIITGMLKPDAGSVFLMDQCAVDREKTDRKLVSRTMQMVFQNPQGSLDPRKRLLDSVTEPLFQTGKSKEEKRELAGQVLQRVGLKKEYLEKFPWEISGGECQRITLARSIINKPKLLICDEATSALDVSVQAQIVQLISELQKELQMGVLFITHDIPLACGLCDDIAVMQDGQIIENRRTEELLREPQQPYTKLLLACS